jgi:hypothetical protein
VETLGTHKDENIEHNATSTGVPHGHPGQQKPNKATSQYDRRRPDQSYESSSPIKPSRITCKQYHHHPWACCLSGATSCQTLWEQQAAKDVHDCINILLLGFSLGQCLHNSWTFSVCPSATAGHLAR